MKASTSFYEQALFYYISQYYPGAISRYQFFDANTQKRIEGDIYISTIKTVIEYDGYYWHKNKTEKDIEKNQFFNSIDLFVIRIRDYRLPILPDYYGTVFFHGGKKGLHTNEFITTTINLLFEISEHSESTFFSLSYEQLIYDKPDIYSLIYEKYNSKNPSNKCGINFWDVEINRHLKMENTPENINTPIGFKCQLGIKQLISLGCLNNKTDCMNNGSNCNHCIYHFCPLIDGCNHLQTCTVLIDLIEKYIQGKVIISGLTNLTRYSLLKCKGSIHAIELVVSGMLSQDELLRFNEMFIVTAPNKQKYFLGQGRLTAANSAKDIETIIRFSELYPEINIMFDSLPFDNSNESRQALLRYIMWYWKKNPYGKSAIISSLFYTPVCEKKCSKEMVYMVKKIFDDYPEIAKSCDYIFECINN